jgi:flagellar hook protein FlgE
MAMTYTFAAITAAQVDADSIINQLLMDAFRDDIYHLQEHAYGVLGTYTPDAEHKHNGTDSALVTSVADNAITPTKVKTTQTTANINSIANGASGEAVTSNFRLGYTLYNATINKCKMTNSAQASYDSYVAIYNDSGGTESYTIYFTYISASQDHVVVYYDQNGVIQGLWHSDQLDFPPKDFLGRELECIYRYDKFGQVIPMGKLILPDSDELVKDRKDKIEHLKKQKILDYGKWICDNYIVDVNKKKMKVKPGS